VADLFDGMDVVFVAARLQDDHVVVVEASVTAVL